MIMCSIVPEKLRRCSDEALKAHGTAYIFEKRAASVRTKLLILNFFGLAGPLSVGAIISTYQLATDTTQIIIQVSGTIAIAQLLLTLWSLVSEWNNKLAYYLESKSANYNLSAQYQRLFQNNQISQTEFDAELMVIEREAEIRASLDNQHDIGDREKRMGMRYGLRHFQRPCVACNIVPVDMKSTGCGVCGKL